ncbi:MAG TPA: hypothetical protein VG708_09910 [Mycobacteriales bacterium]|nr:hypothetical protein [Mycobacteriales bacterium]
MTVITVVAALTATGCNTSALTKRELVVYFNPNAPLADHAHALNSCAHATSGATPEPTTSSTLPSQVASDIRFRIDHANDKQLSILEACLQRQPGVVGVDIPDVAD